MALSFTTVVASVVHATRSLARVVNKNHNVALDDFLRFFLFFYDDHRFSCRELGDTYGKPCGRDSTRVRAHPRVDPSGSDTTENGARVIVVHYAGYGLYGKRFDLMIRFIKYNLMFY